jgi:hypothetical protein
MGATSLTAFLQLGLKDNLTKPLPTVVQALKTFEDRVKAVTKGMANTGASDKFIASLAKIKLSAKDIDAVSKAWQAYSKSAGLAANSSSWTKEQLAGVRSWESQTVSALRKVSAEQARFFARQNRMARESRGMFSLAKPLSMLGGPMVGMAIGGGLLAETKKALTSGADVQSSRVKMAAAGISADEIRRAEDQAMSLVTKYNNVTLAAALDSYKEVRSVLLKPSETPEMMPAIIAAKASMNAIDRSGELASGLTFAVKGAEVLGLAQDPKRFAAYLDAFIRAQQTMGKTITPEQQFEFAKYIKAAGPNLSDRFKMTTGVSMGQEMGGSMAAQGLYMFERQLQGGFQGQQHAAAKEFVAIGLAKLGDFDTTKTGEIKGMKRGRNVAGAALAASDPDLWVHRYLVPALVAHGYKTVEQQTREIMRLFPAGRSADAVTKLVTQAESYINHAKLYGEALGMNGFAVNEQDPYVALSTLGTAIGNFTAVLTSPLMKPAAEALSWAADRISSFAEWYAGFAKQHPELATGIGAASVAGGLTGAGLLLNSALGGFGLKGSAAALDVSAHELSAAAARLGVGGGAGAAAGAGGAAAAAAPWVGGFSLAGLATWLGIDFGTAAADVKSTVDYARLTDDERKRMRDDVKAIPSLVPGLTVGELQNRNRETFLNFFGLGPGPGNDRSKLPYAGQLPPGVFPLKDPALTGDGAWRPTPSQKAMAGAYGYTIPDVKPAADEGKAALDALNATVRPQVDTSDITRARGELQAFLDDLARAGSLMGGLGTRSVGPPPSLGATQRGSFTTAWPGD